MLPDDQATEARPRGSSDAPPPPPNSGDPSLKKSWELEAYVFERLARQLRTVGDGFAWRCFGYNRQVIQALSRNDSAGPMYGKVGLPSELGTIQHLWESGGHFALHHDLTNCLRIADLTEFTGDGGALLHEVKRTSRTEKMEIYRAQAAINALMDGGDLPGGRPGARLVQLDEPYVTNVKQLGELIELAKEHGCQGMALSQGRALIASSGGQPTDLGHRPRGAGPSAGHRPPGDDRAGRDCRRPAPHQGHQRGHGCPPADLGTVVDLPVPVG